MANDDKNAGGLEITQQVSAPVDDVFSAWTTPSETRKWWGPKDFTAEVFDADVRVGGAWHSVIRGPEGKRMGQRGEYVEITPNKRLVFTFRWEEEGALDTTITVDFEEKAGGTSVRFRQSPFKDEEDKRSHTEGWQECLDRLVEYAKSSD